MDNDRVDLSNRNSDEYEIFVAPRSPFAQFRNASLSPQIAVFAAKAPGAIAPTLAYLNEYREVVGCVCRDRDCTGRWPISTADAWSEIHRPFVCAQIFDAGEGNGQHLWVLRALVGGDVLTEPSTHR
jgi:hypothetical protein